MEKRQSNGLNYLSFVAKPESIDGPQDPHPHDQCLDPKFVIGYDAQGA
jgi:WD40 repeat protein